MAILDAQYQKAAHQVRGAQLTQMPPLYCCLLQLPIRSPQHKLLPSTTTSLSANAKEPPTVTGRCSFPLRSEKELRCWIGLLLQLGVKGRKG